MFDADHPATGSIFHAAQQAVRTRAEMKRILKDIQTGKFTSEWIRECKAGQPHFKATRRLNDAHQVEEVGAKLRAMMPWIKERALVDKSRN